MSGKILEVILSFPFKQLGEVLRKLSLSSDAGNIGAWILYVTICLVPAVIFVVKVVRKKNKKEDWLLPVISAVLFYVMYIMINPSLVFKTNYLMDDYIGYDAFGGIIYSAIIGYLVLKLIRRFKGAKQQSICKWLGVLLCIVNVVLILNMVAGLESIVSTIKNVNAGNYDEFADAYEFIYEDMNEDIPEELYDAMGNDEELAPDLGLMEYEYQGLGLDVDELVSLTQIFLILRYIVSIIPSVTAFIVIVMVQRFLNEYGKSGICDETIAWGNKVSKVAIKAAIINVLTNIGFNILQMIFFRNLLDTYTKVELPLTSLIFILAMPLITKLITTSKEIKEENDMFV